MKQAAKTRKAVETNVLLFQYKTVKLLHLHSPIVNYPKAKFHYIAGLQLTGAGYPQITDKNLRVEVYRVAAETFVALQDTAENAIDGVGKFPFCDKLVVGIRVGCADLNEELERVARRLGARLVVVEPAHIEAIEAQGIGVVVAGRCK